MKKLTFAVCIAWSLSTPVLASDAAHAEHADAEKMVGDAAAGKTKAVTCQACHGADGNSPAGMYPSIAGQHEAFILAQLKAFKGGERKDPLMSPMAAPLAEQDMHDLAAFFSAQKIKMGTANKELVAQGEALYRGGNPASGVAACTSCHGPVGAGNPYTQYPAIHGQWPEYTLKQLKAYQAGTRKVNANSDMMIGVAKNMTEAEMKAVAEYIAGLY